MTFLNNGAIFTNGFNADGVNCGIAEAVSNIGQACSVCRAEHRSSRNVREAYAKYAVESCILGKGLSEKPPEDYKLLPITAKVLDTGKRYTVYTIVVEEEDKDE